MSLKDLKRALEHKKQGGNGLEIVLLVRRKATKQDEEKRETRAASLLHERTTAL